MRICGLHNSHAHTDEEAVLTPSEQTLPIKANMDVIRQLQQVTAPQVFTPRCVYDGRKNLFSIRRLPFTDDTATVSYRSAYCSFYAVLMNMISILVRRSDG